MLSVLLYSKFTVQIMYKLYSLQLNFTYSNYTETATKCSAAQQHSTFTVQILYKLYSLKLNCTYSNYTEAAATCSAAQQHTKLSRLMYSELQCSENFFRFGSCRPYTVCYWIVEICKHFINFI